MSGPTKIPSFNFASDRPGNFLHRYLKQSPFSSKCQCSKHCNMKEIKPHYTLYNCYSQKQTNVTGQDVHFLLVYEIGEEVPDETSFQCSITHPIHMKIN
jgi:hypothetical protein